MSNTTTPDRDGAARYFLRNAQGQQGSIEISAAGVLSFRNDGLGWHFLDDFLYIDTMGKGIYFPDGSLQTTAALGGGITGVGVANQMTVFTGVSTVGPANMFMDPLSGQFMIGANVVPPLNNLSALMVLSNMWVGQSNQINIAFGGGSPFHFISGQGNSILDQVSPCAIVGGVGTSMVSGIGFHGSNFAGGINQASFVNSDFCATVGSNQNTFGSSANCLSIGAFNALQSSGYSFLFGISNLMQRASHSILGGSTNLITHTAGVNFNAIVTGNNNTITESFNAFIGCGDTCVIGPNADYSFVNGRQGQALHTGCFVWAGINAAPFATTIPSSVIFRADGGFGFNTNITQTGLGWAAIFRAAVDQDLIITLNTNLANGVSLISIDDAQAVLKGLEIFGNPVVVSTGNLGVHVTAPHTVTHTRSFAGEYRYDAAGGNILATDWFIEADAAGGAITETLPTAAGIAGREYTVKRINAGLNTVTVNCTGAETIDGAAAVTLLAIWQSLTVVSNGANWLIK